MRRAFVLQCCVQGRQCFGWFLQGLGLRGLEQLLQRGRLLLEDEGRQTEGREQAACAFVADAGREC